MSKAKVTLDYEKLKEDIKEQIKLVYPHGFSDHLIRFNNKDGKSVSALRFETDEKIYLIRMSYQQALDIIDADPDYDEDGSLNDVVREDYEDKHSDIDYLGENDNYDDDRDEKESRNKKGKYASAGDYDDEEEDDDEDEEDDY